MKRGREGRGSGPPAKRGRGPPVGVGRSAFKVLCPDRLVAAVLGSSGQTVAKIQEHSGCHCNFSRRNEFFPDTNLRLLVISGPGPAEIVACLELLLEQAETLSTSREGLGMKLHRERLLWSLS
ncbi:BTR1 [Symbiodinium necroappetens]|uniref:BTR1 protein n=1 Tax=Symbiodinium necroappetens TaxID=1628268 RepID=A0A812XI33_9DINO|nr:BTR1 [Symbiodinium necroappetens]